MKNTYLFIKSNDIILDLSNYNNFSDIHIWNYTKIINYNSQQKIHFYAKNISELKQIIEEGFIPHLCFIGDSIFSSFYENTLHFNNIERFWFPSIQNIDNDKMRFLLLKNISNVPIAISYNQYLQDNIDYKNFLTFIKDINQSFCNPLFEKDISLQEKEVFSEDNKAIIDGIHYYVILGLFGDYFTIKKPNDLELLSGIMKDKNCVICEFAEICKNRGLGFIKYDNKIQSCIGIKLFNQS